MRIWPFLTFRNLFRPDVWKRQMANKPDHLERTAQNTRIKKLSRAEVTQIETISPAVKKLSLKVAEKDFTFKPGQWVDFYIPGVETVGGYSMCSSPLLLNEESILELAVKYSTHPPAHWVHTVCKEGDEVSLRVGGDFFLDVSNNSNNLKEIVLIGGGVGINPLLSILLHLKDVHRINQTTYSITLLYSAKTIEELIFKDVLQCLAQDYVGFKVRFHITKDRILLPPLEQNVSACRITEDTIREVLSGEPAGAHCWLCGPGAMTDDMEQYLINTGVNSRNIHYEKWW